MPWGFSVSPTYLPGACQLQHRIISCWCKWQGRSGVALGTKSIFTATFHHVLVSTNTGNFQGTRWKRSWWCAKDREKWTPRKASQDPSLARVVSHDLSKLTIKLKKGTQTTDLIYSNPGHAQIGREGPLPWGCGRVNTEKKSDLW